MPVIANIVEWGGPKYQDHDDQTSQPESPKSRSMETIGIVLIVSRRDTEGSCDKPRRDGPVQARTRAVCPKSDLAHHLRIKSVLERIGNV